MHTKAKAAVTVISAPLSVAVMALLTSVEADVLLLSMVDSVRFVEAYKFLIRNYSLKACCTLMWTSVLMISSGNLPQLITRFYGDCGYFTDQLFHGVGKHNEARITERMVPARCTPFVRLRKLSHAQATLQNAA